MSDAPDPIPSRPLSRHSWVLIATGVVLVAAVAAARAWLYDSADERHFVTDPLPRPKINAPFIKSSDDVVDQMIEVAEISADDLVYDLGCGDGKIVISAAVQRGCRGVGFDINPERIEEAERNAKEQGVDHLVTFREADIFTVDLREADVIVMYLLPWMVKELVPQFDRCPPGTRIVSHDWKIDGIQEQSAAQVKVEDNTHHVLLYVTPLPRLPPDPRKKKTASQ